MCACACVCVCVCVCVCAYLRRGMSTKEIGKDLVRIALELDCFPFLREVCVCVCAYVCVCVCVCVWVGWVKWAWGRVHPWGCAIAKDYTCLADAHDGVKELVARHRSLLVVVKFNLHARDLSQS